MTQRSDRSAMHEKMAPALNILRILSHPVRLSILCHLVEQAEMSAGEIVALHAPLASQSQTSQYLKRLRDEGLVNARKDGLYVYYSLARQDIRELVATLHDLYCPEA